MEVKYDQQLSPDPARPEVTSCYSKGGRKQGEAGGACFPDVRALLATHKTLLVIKGLTDNSKNNSGEALRSCIGGSFDKTPLKTYEQRARVADMLEFPHTCAPVALKMQTHQNQI